MALRGLRVLEIAGLAPGPFAGVILADFGAHVIRVDKLRQDGMGDNLSRGKQSIAVDLKSPEGRAVVARLAKDVDVVIEPFRPGVMEKLGLGPDKLLAANPRLIYARLTGFGQTGPYANMAGHDINYISISGALSLFGHAGQRPSFPANVFGDFAGGGMLCVLGILLALFERQTSGKGQVVDAAMVDGAAYLSLFIQKMHQQQMWNKPRGENLLDSGAPFYDTYKTKDGLYMAVGALEPQFYQQFITLLGVSEDPELPSQMDVDSWPALRTKLTTAFASKTRAEWVAIFDGTDACVTPVLSLDEAPSFRHNTHRAVFVSDHNGQMESGPAPRLSRTPGGFTDEKGGRGPSRPLPALGQHTAQVLQQFGYSASEIAALQKAKAVMALDSKL